MSATPEVGTPASASQRTFSNDTNHFNHGGVYFGGMGLHDYRSEQSDLTGGLCGWNAPFDIGGFSLSTT
jgi:hypothetical protein